LSTDAEPLPTIEITRDSQTPAAGSEIQFHAEVGSIQESTVYWSIWNDDAVSDDASAEAINLQQDTGTEQTYVPSGTGNHAVTCVLIDQQRPVITYLSESFEVSSSSIPATVFQRAENVANSPFAIAGLGAVAVGIGYTAYQRIRSDTTDRDSTDETQQLPETASNLRADDGSNKSLTVDSHAVITLGDQIEYGNSIHIREGTVDYQTVWAITPVSTGETISSAQATAFVDRITPWTQMDAHSCLLTVYGSGSDPLPWVAVEPGDYRQLSDQVDTFSTNELLSAIGQICEAVHHVHRYGTTYENLTTESVLYTDDDELKLRGVVDQLEESDPWYTAPEEFDGESDEQSVVYRIGLIAYELFTGTLPYKQYPNVDAEEAIEAAELIPPSEQIASLPVDLDEITLRALSKAPADRQETVLHLRDELQAVK
jgi:hypothetical protein